MFLSRQTTNASALIDRALYLPEQSAQDPERPRTACVLEEVDFATKPRLARRLVERVLAAGSPPGVCVRGRGLRAGTGT